MAFVAKTRLDKIFEIGILLKAFDGLLEVVGGLLLLLVRPEYINHLAAMVTQSELSEDPKDFIASHILHSAQALNHGALVFGAIYLLSHGIVKVVLVAEILRDRFWAYKGLIVVTALFMIYQIYRFGVDRSWLMVVLTLYDAVVVYLTVIEYRKRTAAAVKAQP